MTVEQKRLDQFDELLRLGETVLQTQRSKSLGYLGNYAAVDESKAKHWGIKCLSLLEEIFGEKSLQYVEFKNLFEGFDSIQSYSNARNALAVLKAAKEIYESGSFTKRIQESEIKISDSSNITEHLISSIELEAKRNVRIYSAIIFVILAIIAVIFFYLLGISISAFTFGLLIISYLLSVFFVKEITPTKLQERLFEYDQNRLRKKFGIDKN
jgi:hypothetical protein